MARQDTGFVLLHRKVNSSAIGRDGYAYAIWCKMITWANWKESRLDGEVVDIGELVTGIDELSEHTGFSRTTIHRKLKLMEAEGMLRRSSVRSRGRKGSKITLINYRKYQGISSFPGTSRGTEEERTGNEPGTDGEPYELIELRESIEPGKGAAKKIGTVEMIALERQLTRVAARIKSEIFGAYREFAGDDPDLSKRAEENIGEPGWSILMRKYKSWPSFCRDYAAEYRVGKGGWFESMIQKMVEGYLATYSHQLDRVGGDPL